MTISSVANFAENQLAGRIDHPYRARIRAGVVGLGAADATARAAGRAASLAAALAASLAPASGISVSGVAVAVGEGIRLKKIEGRGGDAQDRVAVDCADQRGIAYR